MRHLPGYITSLDEIKDKKVDMVAVLAFNDAWVMSAWAKANQIKDEIVSVSYLRMPGTGEATSEEHSARPRVGSGRLLERSKHQLGPIELT